MYLVHTIRTRNGVSKKRPTFLGSSLKVNPFAIHTQSLSRLLRIYFRIYARVRRPTP
jgi:hypothetical protein